ncbi:MULTISPECIES: hypothetical protein [Burkholderia]|uniref:Uncharacterized protein n=2 Tax=Burkholderia cepacia complex TaxID=87882 RepID=A0AAP1V5J1_9BURK|nr:MULTISPECIES: hypothetical protein [Burkholderia]MBK1902258.1 hypothetical protein [Burkholderia contaminans]MBK1910541.1 hypothetical protein [Burkholderia contaminans]MBK1924000.1 hypothetical protein [Burkholderia contaminans]MBK1932212.1 hypothetical protein [Burkholderia contaminans]MBK1939461.1 hypothetical protein [Burkholderia contaminans]
MTSGSKERNDWGYFQWWPDAFTGWGTPLKPHAAKVLSGIATTRVLRYDDCDSDVKPYEWMTGFEASESQIIPDAVACGMVYVLPREGGYANCSFSDLRWASDAVSDTDVAQMVAFLTDTADASDLVQCGDLCFVWLWERRQGSEKGLGAKVLEAALVDLKKRFRGLKTLIVSLVPAPAGPEGQRTASSQRASAALRTYAEKARLHTRFGDRAQLRFIHPKERTEEETVMLLGLTDFLDRRS